MEVSDQFHAPSALSPGKKLQVHIEYEGGWASQPVWTLWRRENRTPAVQPVARRYTDVHLTEGNSWVLQRYFRCGAFSCHRVLKIESYMFVMILWHIDPLLSGDCNATSTHRRTFSARPRVGMSARPRARNVRHSGRVRATMRLMSVFLFRIKGRSCPNTRKHERPDY
jgi:hypothetical protein